MKINVMKTFEVIALSFVVIEIVSLLVSSISPSIPLIKGGYMLMLFLAVIVITYLYGFSIRILQGEFNLKRDVPLLLIIIGVVGLLYYFLPQAIPQLFSIEGTSGQSVRDFLAGNIGSVLSTRTGVASIINVN